MQASYIKDFMDELLGGGDAEETPALAWEDGLRKMETATKRTKTNDVMGFQSYWKIFG